MLNPFNKNRAMRENIFLIGLFIASCLTTILIVSIKLNEKKKPTVILIGATGKQGQAYFNVLKEDVKFVAFVVSAQGVFNKNRQDLLDAAVRDNIQVFEGIEELKRAMRNKEIDFEIAIIATPHHLHKEFTTLLLKNNKTIIKEKPLALNYQEVEYYEEVLQSEELPIFTIVQRHFQESLQEAKKDLHLIGKPLSFFYEYYFNLPSVTSGWRAEKLKSGGGVVIDMGYHIVDIVNDFFGMPILNETEVTFGFCYEDMFEKQLEDEAIIHLSYASKLKGEIKLSRHNFAKEECIIKGTLGTMKVDLHHYEIYDIHNNLIKLYKSTQTKAQNNFAMLDSYIRNRHNKKYQDQELMRHKNNIYIIDNIYKVATLNNHITGTSL